METKDNLKKSKGNFLSKFISFLLVLIIIGGIGFLGYKVILGRGGMDMSSMTSRDTSKSDNSSSHEQMTGEGSSSKDSMNMGNSTNGGTSDKQYSTTVINAVAQNKSSVEKTIVSLNESLKLMTLDPYGVDTKQRESMNSTANSSQQNNDENKTTTNATNTTVNVYPQNSTSQVTAMQGMGTTYDAAKMEKLHTGLYKVSVGIQLLDQLKNNLSVQLEQASMEVKDPSQYYYNQYLITLQNKNKLTEAITYINEANSLLNINPYVSQNGAVYNKERMSQVHDSIYKLAQVIVDLNKINDNFLNQTITLGNMTQNYINNVQSMENMNMDMTNTNFFGNVSAGTVFNALVVVFLVIFIVSILGYINRLLKETKNTR